LKNILFESAYLDVLGKFRSFLFEGEEASITPYINSSLIDLSKANEFFVVYGFSSSLFKYYCNN
jgi:hypothetical protein